MLIDTSKSDIYIKSFNKNKEIPFFFIHGFTGSSSSWFEIIESLDKYCYAIDIVGHGKSTFKSLEDTYTVSDWCNEFYMLLHQLSIHKINICGYSMGGRLAIAFASKYPEKINSMILESTTVGLNETEERRECYDKDSQISSTIKTDLSSFIDSWEENPLFLKQKERNQEAWKRQQKIRLSHNPLQLSKALRIFSKGSMSYYESKFQDFSFPISIINGSEDDKYIKIGKDMTIMNNKAKQYIIQDTMHNTHLESPEMFIDVLNNTIYE